MPIANGTIMKYLQGDTDNSLTEIRFLVDQAKTKEEIEHNILLIKNEIKCNQIANDKPLVNKGMAGGAIAGSFSAFIKSAIEHNFILTPQTILAHMLYGAVIGTTAGLSIDQLKAPLSRFFKPITSRIFHDRQKDINSLLAYAESQLMNLDSKCTVKMK